MDEIIITSCRSVDGHHQQLVQTSASMRKQTTTFGIQLMKGRLFDESVKHLRTKWRLVI